MVLRFTNLFGRSLVAASLCAWACGGCNLNTIMANGMGRMAEQAAPGLERHWDAELVLDGVSNGIVQLEAMRSVAPDSRGLNLELARAYLAYGYGRLELRMEQHLAAGENDAAAHERARLQQVYLRAKDLGLAAMGEQDDGIYAALDGGADALERYLDEAYDEPESLEPLYWTSMALGFWALAAEQPDMVLEEAEQARRMAEHVAAVQPAYRNGGALAVAGRLACDPALAGPEGAEAGRKHFEQGLAVTERRAHLLHVHFARSCVRHAGQRELYVQLLEEVLQAPDQGDALRMANKIARARAEWYLPRTHLDLRAP